MVLEQAERQYRSRYDKELEGFFKTTPSGQYLTVSQTLAELYGYACPKELLKSLTDIENQLYVNPNRRQDFINLLQENKIIFGFESEVYRQDGSIIWISENAKAIRNERDEILYYEGTIKDVTQRVSERRKLYYLIYYDILTELPNRSFVVEQLSKLINSNTKSENLALLILNLERFRLINSSLSVSIGQQLLKDIANRLKNVTKETDFLARLGGDEFAILLKKPTSLEEVIHTVEKIQRIFHEPLHIQNYCLFTEVSIGILYTPLLHGKCSLMGAETLFSNANIALEQAKSKAKGSYCVFKPKMYSNALGQLRLETDIHKAISRSEFVLHYQPIIDLFTEEIQGFEALVRWNHPHQGMIYPPGFIGVAEDAGFIISLGRWILQEAIHQISQWQETFKKDLFMSINLSVKQFSNPQLVNDIQRILETTEIRPETIHLEITESSCIYDEESALTKLSQLKEKGLKISIDDFGTGYSSLNYLHQLPIDVIKIDRGFISEINTDSAKAKIARSVLRLANDLGLETIAEGIETLEQFNTVKETSCRLGQGYLFAKPLKVEDARNFITKSLFSL